MPLISTTTVVEASLDWSGAEFCLNAGGTGKALPMGMVSFAAALSDFGFDGGGRAAGRAGTPSTCFGTKPPRDFSSGVGRRFTDVWIDLGRNLPLGALGSRSRLTGHIVQIRQFGLGGVEEVVLAKQTSSESGSKPG